MIEAFVSLVVGLLDVKTAFPGTGTFGFGDNLALCDALRIYSDSSIKPPKVGRRDIALDWDGHPVLVIEIIGVSNRRFCDVDEDFALADGVKVSLQGWRTNRQVHFEPNGEFDPETPLVCERFRLVRNLG